LTSAPRPMRRGAAQVRCRHRALDWAPRSATARIWISGTHRPIPQRRPSSALSSDVVAARRALPWGVMSRRRGARLPGRDTARPVRSSRQAPARPRGPRRRMARRPCMHLHRTASGHASPNSETGRHRALRELLRDDDSEREAGVDGLGGCPLGGGHPALRQHAVGKARPDAGLRASGT
jgi:hypothetical protein